MKERCIDIRCIFFFAVILHRIDDNKDNFRTTIVTTCDRINVPRSLKGMIQTTIIINFIQQLTSILGRQ